MINIFDGISLGDTINVVIIFIAFGALSIYFAVKIIQKRLK